jgi:hypothetical protein
MSLCTPPFSDQLFTHFLVLFSVAAFQPAHQSLAEFQEVLSVEFKQDIGMQLLCRSLTCQQHLLFLIASRIQELVQCCGLVLNKMHQFEVRIRALDLKSQGKQA